MSLTLNTNMSSLIVQKNLNESQATMAKSMQRITSGLRINSASDDAAGLGIGTRMDSQIRGMNVAVRNTNDGISMLQTADGALGTITSAFQRMRELAVQASNDSNSTTDLANLDKEYQQLNSEVTRISGATKFNNQAIISTDAKTFNFQVGANASDTLSVATTDATTYFATPGDLTSTANAKTAMGALDTALDTVNTDRATYGAALNRFDFTVQNLTNSINNQTAAKSRIMDTNYSQETASLAKSTVLQQAGVAMLSQANQSPNTILSLLR